MYIKHAKQSVFIKNMHLHPKYVKCKFAVLFIRVRSMKIMFLDVKMHRLSIKILIDYFEVIYYKICRSAVLIIYSTEIPNYKT